MKKVLSQNQMVTLRNSNKVSSIVYCSHEMQRQQSKVLRRRAYNFRKENTRLAANNEILREKIGQLYNTIKTLQQELIAAKLSYKL